MSAYSQAVLNDVPSLYWRLGESSGNFTDSSGNARTGTAVGSPTYSVASALTGDANTAITVTQASSQYVTCAYAPFTASSLRTFEFWANRTNTAAVDYLFGTSVNPSPFLRLTAASTNVVFAPDSNSTFTTFTAAWPGTAQWVHTVLTFNDATDAVDLFINGTSVGATTNAVTWAATASTFQLAQRGVVNLGWTGSLDEVAIYESILSAAHIQNHYNIGKGKFQPPKSRIARPRIVVPSGAVYS